MRVLKLEKSLREAYSHFLSQQPLGLIYHSPTYLDFVCDVLNARNETGVAVDSTGAVRGILPLLARDGPWGLIYNSLPFFGSNGSILASDDTARQALMDWYNAIAIRADVASCTLITNPLDRTPMTQIRHTCTDFRIGQLSPLKPSLANEDALLSTFHYKTRNMIRKAIKLGITVSIDNSRIDFLHKVHKKNLTSLGGTPKPEAFFRLLPKYFQEDQDFRIYVADFQGEMVAALLAFYFNDVAEYFMPVIEEQFRDMQPMSLLVSRAMSDAARLGRRWWNWGGTWPSQDGVYRFKSRWGTIDQNYYYYTQLNHPSIALCDRATINSAYPYFYVLPFQLLRSSNA